MSIQSIIVVVIAIAADAIGNRFVILTSWDGIDWVRFAPSIGAPSNSMLFRLRDTRWLHGGNSRNDEWTLRLCYSHWLQEQMLAQLRDKHNRIMMLMGEHSK